MLTSLKALVVVLTLATIVFAMAKPICLRFTAEEDFVRRRNIWYVLTVVAFLSPSFWLYALVAMPVLAWAAQKDASPVALFLFFFFVIPNANIEIPVVGINRLFEFNNSRLLCFVVLLPAIMRRPNVFNAERPFRLSAMDWMLLSYGVLQLALFLPYESYTNTVRRTVLFMLDTYIFYFACSRLLTQRRDLRDAMGTLWLSGSILALLACFESLRGWLLYVEIAARWGDPNNWAFLMRGDSLRAQVSTGHALTLGYVLSMALGCWMYLKSQVAGKFIKWAVIGLFCAGLIFCYSRGPWLTAILVCLIFVALASQNAKNLIKTAMVLTTLAFLFSATPWGASLIDSMPFIGTRDQDTVEYRRELFETSWSLIKQNPLLGNPFVLLDMENLRQGQGIIDLVNGFLQVALFYGFIGLALFCGVHFSVLGQALISIRIARMRGDNELVVMGAALIACVAANLFFMATAGQSWGQWIFAGLLASYASLCRSDHPVPSGEFSSSATYSTEYQS